MEKQRMYICIDLKSFYASVECVERGLNALTTNLVVADESRTNKTICLAVSPSLKMYGLPGRPRLYEVEQKVKKINEARRRKAVRHVFTGKSSNFNLLQADSNLAVDYIVAPPRMRFYMKYSSDIYGIYLRYVSAEDIHVYSIDEVFIDVTDYLNTYKMTAHELALKMIREVLKETGITATAGIGTNMYLAKIAMDIVAKKMPADEDGVRIAELDEMSYRRLLWSHQPLTDFWRVGRGISNHLARMGIHTMGDICEMSLKNEDLLYKEFGVNAELMIDHAWGYESCTMKDIKSYTPSNNSVSNSQVLSRPHTYKEAYVIMKEMADAMALDLFSKSLVTNHLYVGVSYDVKSLEGGYDGDIITDYYGRPVPKPSHKSVKLKKYTSSSEEIIKAVMQIYSDITNRNLLIRKLYVGGATYPAEAAEENQERFRQYDLFTDVSEAEEKRTREKKKLEKEKKIQRVMLDIKDKYGKNAILKGMNYEESATARERNRQVGGHKE